MRSSRRREPRAGDKCYDFVIGRKGGWWMTAWEWEGDIWVKTLRKEWEPVVIWGRPFQAEGTAGTKGTGRGVRGWSPEHGESGWRWRRTGSWGPPQRAFQTIAGLRLLLWVMWEDTGGLQAQESSGKSFNEPALLIREQTPQGQGGGRRPVRRLLEQPTRAGRIKA